MVDTIRLIIKGLKIDSNKCEKLTWTDYPGRDSMKCKYGHCICKFITGDKEAHGSTFKVEGGLYKIFGGPKDQYLFTVFPRVLNPRHNLNPYNKDQAKLALNKLYNSLCEDGIELELENSLLSRVDLFKNIYLNHPFESYTPLFETLRASRLKKLPHESSWYFNNTLRGIIIYDKKGQMKDTQKIEKSNTSIVRFEYRMKKRQKCKNDLPFDTFGELIDGWDSLPSIYHKLMTEFIFKSADKYSVKKCDAKSDLDELIWFHDNFSRRWFEKYLLVNGASKVMEKVGDIDLVHRELIDNSLSSYPMRQIKILNSYLLMNGEKSQYGASVREMYDEIRSELLKPVADYLDESEMIP